MSVRISFAVISASNNFCHCIFSDDDLEISYAKAKQHADEWSKDFKELAPFVVRKITEEDVYKTS